jgi:putative endonuclease
VPVAIEAITDAIQREKNVKRWLRQWKIELIEATNPTWRALWVDISPL